MNNQQTLPFEGASKTPLPPKFNVVIIYETVADGNRAKRFSDRVAAELDGGYDMAINVNVWSFQVLRMPEMLYLAASAAATANMIIVSATGTKTLPAQLKHWITTWSYLLNGRRPLLVGLFANSAEEHSPIHAELRKASLRKGLPFFSPDGPRSLHDTPRQTFRPDGPSCLGGKGTRSTAGNACSADVIRTQEQDEPTAP